MSSPWQQVLPPSPTHFYPEAFFPLLSLLLSDSPISSSSSSSRFPVFSCHILSGEKKREEFAQGRKKLNKEKAFFEKEGKRRKLNFLSRARLARICHVFISEERRRRKENAFLRRILVSNVVVAKAANEGGGREVK